MEEDDPNPEFEKINRAPIFRRDRHLASALSNGEIQYLFRNWENPPGLKKEHRLLIKDTKGVMFLPSEQYVHWALRHVSGCRKAAMYNKELNRHIRVAQDATILGHRNYTRVPLFTASENHLIIEENLHTKTDSFRDNGSHNIQQSL